MKQVLLSAAVIALASCASTERLRDGMHDFVVHGVSTSSSAPPPGTALRSSQTCGLHFTVYERQGAVERGFSGVPCSAETAHSLRRLAERRFRCPALRPLQAYADMSEAGAFNVVRQLPACV